MRFLEIIDRSFIGRFVQSRLNILEHTDPNRIYVENIRSFYGLPTFMAKFLCEMAVKEGLFAKRVGVECPNEGRLIMTADSVDKLPRVINCSNCEALENDRHEFALSECHLVEFYKLNV
ncbi:MAG: hypothetical protein EOO61_15560 [Hymenobacter sp.]|nr:MAG: hypothetical protein EOO61_15560 [Hymenobacter sp.]